MLIDRDYLFDLAIDLCNVSSPNGHELDAAMLLAERMSRLGLEVEMQRFAPDRANAIGRLRGAGTGRSLMFVGHLENNEFPRSTELPTARLLDDGRLTGVGMWNMKGPVAAYLAAVAAVRAAGVELAGDVVVAGVAGTYDQTLAVDTRLRGSAKHEGYSIGTRHMLAQGIRADVGVVGEPTSFAIVPRHFGLVGLRISVEAVGGGTESVVLDDLTARDSPADVAVGRSAIESAAEAVLVLREWATRYRAEHTLDGIAPGVHVRAIEGGNPWMGGDGGTALFLSVNTVPGMDAGKVAVLVSDALESTGRKAAGYAIRVTPYLELTPPAVSDDHVLVTAMSEAHAEVFGTPIGAAVVQWHSDATPLADHGIPAVNYGCPGRYVFHPGGRVADEYVAGDDLVDLARVYLATLLRVSRAPLD